MSHLIESNKTDQIADLRKQFSQNGYLFIKSFFNSKKIVKVRNLVIDILEESNWGIWKGNRFIAIEPVRRINSEDFHKCLTLLMQQELIHELSQDSNLSNFLSQLLGEKVYSHPRKMIRITYPYHMNPNDRIPPHQDIVYVKGEKDTFTSWIPLGDYSPELGGLEVSPQTHIHGLFPMQANSEKRFGCTAIEENVKDFVWGKANFQIGDLLIMHSLTLHRSGVNNGSEFRLSLDCRLSSSKGWINEEQLLPPYYPKLPEWDLLNSMWKNQNRFDLPSSIKIHKSDKDLIEIMSTTSRFAK